MASSSSSSLLCQTKYDVFLSFRGTDVRHGFLSHLTKELRLKQIDAYVDERVESGEEISSALVMAIEGSMISLVIFSEKYAASKWCLEELVKIMECNKVNNNQIVIPVFYNVDPTHVRHQKGTYGDAFVEHEQKYNRDKLQSWRSALNRAANLSGYHSSNFKDESKLINEIVKDVLNKLDDDVTPDKSPRLVGFDRNFSHVESLLEIESQEVRVIGIWGMRGIGKTTLARAIYDKYSSKYQSCCFMENVREESLKINGLSYLLRELYCQLLEEDNLDTSDVLTKRSIKRRLSRKKVLIVLDDVDNFEQLEYLLGEQNYLGLFSRVIITSRDRHVLKGVHAIHEIGELKFEEALELFSLYAFNERYPIEGFEELSKSVVLYAKGIPLALKVLGLHLHSRSNEAWEDVVRKLQKHPNMQIQRVLRVSYDGLDAQEQNIFLDIAFFFRGYSKVDVIGVLDACGFYATSGIEQLLDKALVTIGDDNKIKMHDLLQEMGEQIVREESCKHPSRRSRLNNIDDLYDLLQKNNGTDEIEGIVLDVSRIKKVYLCRDTFIKMPNLRILKMYSGPWCEKSNVDVPFGIESFSDKLRYFHWDEYPLESMPPNFNTEKLVEFRMERSQVKKLWDEIKDLENLKIVNLNGSKQLIELPDFSKATNLEKLLLSDCESLCRVHPTILSLYTPVHLDLTRCHALRSRHVAELHSLTSLKRLSLCGCKQVNKMVLQILFDGSRCLESLDLGYCNNLVEIPTNISSLSLLKSLNVEGSSVEILPSSIKHLSKLQSMCLNSCKIKSLPELPLSIKFLHADCPSLQSVLPFTNSMFQVPENNREMVRLDYAFHGWTDLDEQSLSNLMVFVHLSMVRAIYCNADHEHNASYVGGTVPKWFTYKETSGVPFTIGLDPTCGQLLGFLVCAILPKLEGGCRICFFFIFEEHEDGCSYAYSNKVLNTWSSSKYTFIWFVPFKNVSREGEKEGRKYDEIGCYYICEASGQAVQGAECGVYPIYASQFDSIIGEILESSQWDLVASANSASVNKPNTYYHDDIDDDKPDREIEIQPNFKIKLNQINNRPPLDKQNERKGLQELLFM